jgi:uncharacterized protein (DUF1330 family)
MTAYLIARVNVTDAEKYREYVKHTPRVVALHGGRFIVRAMESVTLEGPEQKLRTVVMEFPSLEHARAFYHSPEYAPVKALRAGAGDAQLIAVEGYPRAEWEAALAASEALGPKFA